VLSYSEQLADWFIIRQYFEQPEYSLECHRQKRKESAKDGGRKNCKDSLDIFPYSNDHRFFFIDRYLVHMMDQFLWMFEEPNIGQVFIPGGLTGEQQPLDVSSNKPHMDYYRAKDH
jgi:hypothetical protein